MMGFLAGRGKAERLRALGDRARDERRWPDAIRFYARYLGRVPNNPSILVQYGHALKETGKIDDAEQAYRRALALDSGEADTYVQLGHVFKLTGRRAQALDAYRTALGYDPSLECAATEVRELVASGAAPELPSELNTKAEAFRRAGDSARDARNWPDAVAAYSKYLEIVPNNAPILVQYAHARKELGQIQDAEHAYRRAIELAPDEADTYVQLGHVYKLTGRREQAIEAYRAALQRDASLQSAIVELERLEFVNQPAAEQQVVPLNGRLSSLLDQSSTIKALGFQMARAEAKLDAISRRLEEVEASKARPIAPSTQPAPLPHLGPLLEQMSTIKALGFQIARAQSSISKVETQYSGVDQRMACIEAALPEVLAATQEQFTEISHRINEWMQRSAALDPALVQLAELGTSLQSLDLTVRSRLDKVLNDRQDFEGLATELHRLGTQVAELCAGAADADARLGVQQSQIVAAMAAQDAAGSAMDGLGSRLEALSEALTRIGERMAERDRDLDLLARRLVAIEARESAPPPNPPAVSPLVEEMLHYLAGRIELVRREVMCEVSQGRRGTLDAVTHIKAPAKLAAARKNGIVLNLGCGHLPLEGHLNIDRRDLPHVDIVAEADDLPFEPGEVQAIHSVHLLEHFPEQMLRDKLLPYWLGLLQPGGRFSAIVPDGKGMLEHFGRDDRPFRADTLITPAILAELLHEAGYVNVEIKAKQRGDDPNYDYELFARRPVHNTVDFEDLARLKERA